MRISLDRLIVPAALLLCIVFLTGCGAAAQSPVLGALFLDVSAPLAIGSGTNKTDRIDLKVGTASATSVLGLVGEGDASIRAACQSAGIEKIHYVDYHTANFLGIYAKFTVIVYGE